MNGNSGKPYYNNNSSNNNHKNNNGGGSKDKPKLPDKSKIVLDFESNRKLLDVTAKEIAEALDTSSTQMRNFYNYILKYYEKLQNGKDFAEILPDITMLNSKVAYSRTRNHTTANFESFMEICLEQIKDEKTFKTFKLLFEAVLGFTKKK